MVPGSTEARRRITQGVRPAPASSAAGLGLALHAPALLHLDVLPFGVGLAGDAQLPRIGGAVAPGHTLALAMHRPAVLAGDQRCPAPACRHPASPRSTAGSAWHPAMASRLWSKAAAIGALSAAGAAGAVSTFFARSRGEQSPRRQQPASCPQADHVASPTRRTDVFDFLGRRVARGARWRPGLASAAGAGSPAPGRRTRMPWRRITAGVVDLASGAVWRCIAAVFRDCWAAAAIVPLVDGGVRVAWDRGGGAGGGDAALLQDALGRGVQALHAAAASRPVLHRSEQRAPSLDDREEDDDAKPAPPVAPASLLLPCSLVTDRRCIRTR